MVNNINTLLVGENAGLSTIKGIYLTCIGKNAGADLTDEVGVVIIGDDIRSIKPGQKDVIYLNDKVLIGKTVLGRPNSRIEFWEENSQTLCHACNQKKRNTLDFSNPKTKLLLIKLIN